MINLSNLLKDNKELMNQWDFDKNKELNLDKLTLGSKKSAWWICDKKHSYEMKIQEKAKGINRCPICLNKRVLTGYNDLATTNPELLKEWDYEKNIISPYEITAGSEKTIWWICKKGHSYPSYPYNRKKGVGCPFCDCKKVLVGYNDLATKNPKLAKEWNYDKNGKLTPKDVTEGSTKDVWWICEKGHEWHARIKERKRGNSCAICSNKKVLVGFNDLYTYCINNSLVDVIEEFDKDKNKFTMEEVTAGSDKETWWICSKCGNSYKSSPSRRVIRGSSCGICSHNTLVKGTNDLLTTNPEIAKEWDYEKNKIGPDEVMAGSNIKKYWFICPKGHSYSSTPLNRKKGNGCPQCNIENHTSIPERTIYYYLKKHIDDVIDSYHDPIIGRKEIDIYLPKYKFGIEYDGRAWHKNIKRDLEKDKLCLKQGITLLRIRENECKKYESNSIKKYISPYDTEDLKESILYIFEYLKKKYNINIKIDIDIERDRQKILELMNLSEKENSVAAYCPNIYEYWDSDKNGIIKPEQISHASEKRIFLKCKKNHHWDSKASDFVLRPYCPFCDGRKVWPGFNDLFTTNPELIVQWSKNNKLDPKTLKKGSYKKALWICQNCKKEYEMEIRNKGKGQLCSYCSHKN